VSEGTRTPDRLDHNQELYQLSYAHRGALNLAADPPDSQRMLGPPSRRAGYFHAIVIVRVEGRPPVGVTIT
jgi:hypothetical protein